MPADVPSRPPLAVCVEQPGGSLRPALVRGSIAGVYDAEAPLRLAHLNWMAAGVGCVTYPGSSTRRARCGSAVTDAPVVTPTPCGQ